MQQVTQAVVLAGGRGTRLGELTAHTPKPLLPVGGRPFLDWIVGGLESQGVTDVILVVGYMPDTFEAWLDTSPSKIGLRSFVESEPLGTGGALPLMTDWLDETFFVLNGDTLFDARLDELAAVLGSTGATGAVALRRVPDTSRYGAVDLEEARVRRFDEKSSEGPGLINGGVYAFRRRAVEGLGSPSSIERDLLPALATEGELVGIESDGFFIDIGIPEDYDRAQREVARWWWAREP